MRKKILITVASLAGVALILFLFFFLGLDNKIAFFTNKADYYNGEDFKQSVTAIDESVQLRIDIASYAGDKTVFFEKDDCALSMEKIDYIQENDCYKVVIVSQGQASAEKAVYLSLDNLRQITSTYLGGTVKMSLKDKSSLGTDGKITYELTITHDEKVSAMDFEYLVCPFFLNNIELVELNRK